MGRKCPPNRGQKCQPIRGCKHPPYMGRKRPPNRGQKCPPFRGCKHPPHMGHKRPPNQVKKNPAQRGPRVSYAQISNLCKITLPEFQQLNAHSVLLSQFKCTLHYPRLVYDSLLVSLSWGRMGGIFSCNQSIM